MEISNGTGTNTRVSGRVSSMSQEEFGRCNSHRWALHVILLERN